MTHDVTTAGPLPAVAAADLLALFNVPRRGGAASQPASSRSEVVQRVAQVGCCRTRAAPWQPWFSTPGVRRACTARRPRTQEDTATKSAAALSRLRSFVELQGVCCALRVGCAVRVEGDGRLKPSLRTA